jgi:hypothetical protein
VPYAATQNGRKALDKSLHKKVEAAWKGTADVLRSHLGKIHVADFVGKRT